MGIIVFVRVGRVNRGGMYFGDDIICVRIWVSDEMSSWFALSLSITNHRWRELGNLSHSICL